MVPNKTWTHVAATYDSAQSIGKIFINGVESKIATGVTKNLSSSNARFGTHANGTSYKFSGRIDEMRVYNRALSAQEVLRLYSMSHTN